ncbi:hypothetical protein BDV35DRAFT_148547 [Aspergillus flavus]|uniref:Uncharacterized protein n=1 Tax=Aspergillus flavus TaxID=5059 RepID=A0A5N6H690_ASPFL|nr:hypothetical protein BDV35DRAFT_148547 [Aspergillus flavus]
MVTNTSIGSNARSLNGTLLTIAVSSRLSNTSYSGLPFLIIIVIAWSIIPRNRSVARLTEMINDDNCQTIYVTKS